MKKEGASMPLDLVIAAHLVSRNNARLQIGFCVTVLSLLASDNEDVPELKAAGFVKSESDVDTVISFLRAVKAADTNPPVQVEA